MQSSTDRGRRVSRHAILWLAGPIVLIANHHPAELTTPHQCAPAIDLLGIAILRHWPDLRIGQLLACLQPAVVVFALAALAELFDRLTRNIAVALGIALTAAFSPLFIPLFSLLTPVATVGLCAAAALVVRRSTSIGHRSLIKAVCAGAILILAALVVPSWTAACALAACAVTWSASAQTGRRVRVAGALATATAVAVVPFAMLRATHLAALGEARWYDCARPLAAGLPALLQQVSWAIGPVIGALAVLGLAVELSRGEHVWWVGIASAFIALACWPAAGLPPLITFAPLFVATWSAAAVGLAEILPMMLSVRGGLVAAVLVLCALPVLEAARVRDEGRDNVVRPQSQDRASLTTMISILNLVPADARFVEEDASIDLLLRAALLGGRRRSKPFKVIPADRRSVEHALEGSTTVWAFPRGQQLLALRGFEIQPGGELRMPGIARVAAVRPCQELGTSWVDLSAEGRHGRIAVVAASETDVGPVDLYFGGPSEYAPGPDGWGLRTRSRFRLRLFVRSAPRDAALLDAEARDQELATHAVFGSPFVSRMLIERTPLSPLELPIVLGPPRPFGLGRLHEDASRGDRFLVCDAPPVTVSPF